MSSNQSLKLQVEVCVTPATYHCFHNDESIVVIVDVLRATSSICTAFMNGAKRLIPVGTVDEAKAMKAKGYVVAAERDGYVLDFADFGNSPFNFTAERVQSNDIVYSTTNGTKAIFMASKSHRVVIGSFLNLTALANWLKAQDRNVVIFCAAWKDKFNLEDTVFAGALAELLLNADRYSTICDGTNAALDLWHLAKNDVNGYMQKSAQKARLASKGLDDCLPYCHTLDLGTCIPILEGDSLIDDSIS